MSSEIFVWQIVVLFSSFRAAFSLSSAKIFPCIVKKFTQSVLCHFRLIFVCNYILFGKPRVSSDKSVSKALRAIMYWSTQFSLNLFQKVSNYNNFPLENFEFLQVSRFNRLKLRVKTILRKPGIPRDLPKLLPKKTTGSEWVKG